MKQVRIINVGLDAQRAEAVAPIFEHITNFPERNIVINLKEWVTRLPSKAHRLLEDGTIEFNSDNFSNPLMIELYLAKNASDALKVWSPVMFLMHYYQKPELSEEYGRLLNNRNDVIVGSVHYRTKSKNCPQYVINFSNGSVQFAKNYAEAFKIIAGTFLTVPVGSVEHPNANRGTYLQLTGRNSAI